ncbi:septal ring lytic transglycosylase RlpA family protein [Candidimonas nitroreducens]|uniref:septal ring lytic transglycosylase RlpA family protein n=1 Tax=Candidimonas nitroreducens TaxID=683354 RepID=UPI0018E9AA3A|nr:septal ring lytic transglycosylase RlpA family protein [Candidimonas nitroreducens]
MTVLRSLAAILTLTCLAVLAGCSTTHTRGGGYYKNDGPGGYALDLSKIPDAVPRIETPSTAASKPYSVFGKRYVPMGSSQPFRQVGTASWYGKMFHGAKTSTGETYNMYAMTAAHPTLPIPSYARVTRVGTGQSVIVRVNDRGPFHSGRIMDLSYVAAAKLGIIGPGSGKVIVDAITNTDIARGNTHLSDIAAATGGRVQPPPQAEPAAEPVVAKAVQEPTPNVMLALDQPSAAADSPQQAPAPAATSDPAPRPQTAAAAYRRPDSGPAPAADADGIYLQFGAFSGAENADRLAQKINTRIAGTEGHNAHVEPGGNLYRVQLGPYPDRGTAVNAAWRIRQSTGMASTLVTPDVALR